MKIRIAILFFFVGWWVNAQFVDTQWLTADNGLFSNNIQVTFVDANGTLWLGSRAGLAMRNGKHFASVPQAMANKFNNIFDIAEDPHQGKWIAGYGQGVLFFDRNTTKLIDENNGLVNNKARRLFYSNGKIYVGTLNGLSIISLTDFSIANPKFLNFAEHFFSVTDFFSIHGKIYATTINDGIYEVTPKELIKVSDLKKTFSTIVWKGCLYLATDRELLKMNPENFQVLQTFPVGNIWKFLPINEELFMVSSGIFEAQGGLFLLKDDQLIDQTNAFKLPFTDLKDLAFDTKNRMLYMGTQDNGLIQTNLNAPVFHQTNVEKVFAINVQDHKQFVFHNRGFTIFNTQQQPVKTLTLQQFKSYQQNHPSPYQKQTVIANHFYPIDYETAAEKIVFYQSQIHNNSLWVASNIGMFQLDLEGNVRAYYPVHVFYFTFFNNELITAVPYAGVRIFHDIATMDYTYFHDWNQPDVPAEIVSIAQTTDAVYFASALSGLYEYKNGTFRSLLRDQSFTEAKIKRICTAKNDEMVVVTDFNDVYFLDVSQPEIKIKKHIPHQKIKGSSTSFVNWINGVLYVGTNEGINVFKENKTYFIDKAQGFSNYNITTTTRFQRDLYIGTTNGIYQMPNDYFERKSTTSDLAQITAIFVNNKPLTLNAIQKNQLQLSYWQNNIRLHFLVPNTKYPDKLQFKFRFKETENWQELPEENQLNLNYADQGIYNVQLQITNLDTASVATQNLLTIVVKPPYYTTLPFVLGCVFLLVVLVFAAYKLRINYLKQKQQQALAVERLKNNQEKKELLFEKQLADVKLQALKSQMNAHFLFNVLNSIQYFIICNDVDNALRYLEKFSSLIRTTLDYSDKKAISLYQEIAYLKEYIEIENLRAHHPIALVVNISENIDSTTVAIAPLLLQPFVENAVVHAFPASVLNPEIQINVEKIAQTYKITIADNGIGYQEKATGKHTSKGIAIVQNRLKLTEKKLGQPIAITTSPKGTQVVLFIDDKNQG